MSRLNWLWLLFLIESAINIEESWARDNYQTNIQNSCCHYGSQHANDVNSCSDLIHDLTHIPKKFHHECRDSTIECCNSRLKQLCNEGMKAAKNHENCAHRQGMWKMCCESCKNGQRQALNGETCNHKSTDFVSHTQAVCCNDEKRNDLLQSLEENEIEESSEQESSGDEYDSREPLDAPEPLIYVKPIKNNYMEGLKVACREKDCEYGCEIVDNKPSCTCPEDYVLSSDNRSCCKSDYVEVRKKDETFVRSRQRCSTGQFLNDFNICEDINECNIEFNACGEDSWCKNTPGSFTCEPKNICRKGFWFNEMERECVDIDECYNHSHDCRCDERCINIPGSYKCEALCLANRPNCRVATTTIRNYPIYFPPVTTQRVIYIPTTESPRKNRTCEYSTSASEEICTESHECIYDSDCNLGFICTTHNDIRVCEEKSCDSGYERVGYECVDINECKRDPCPITSDCENLEGSYKCVIKKCSSGYALDEFGDCRDINECKLHIDKCENSKCHNIDGSYECHCHDGYKKSLYNNDNICEDIDECAKNPCDQTCKNTLGSFYCTCKSGFNLGYDKRTCMDIDECLTNPCPKTSTCINLQPSYKCERIICDDGLILNDDGICEDINECKMSNICVNGDCRNSHASYSCSCHNGFEPDEVDDNICNDIDECNQPNDCDHECSNLHGSYECLCRAGFKLNRNGKSCDDINECHQDPCKRSEECENSPGSYSCIPKSCPDGFYNDGYDCVDVDECKESNLCLHGTCHNTDGSYYCTCDHGLRLNEDNQCVDIDECEENPSLCMHKCNNTFKSYTCSCRKGFRLRSDGRHCEDVDECREGTNNCRPNQDCKNSIGRFSCINKCEKVQKPCRLPPPNEIIQPCPFLTSTTTTTTTSRPCRFPPPSEIVQPCPLMTTTTTSSPCQPQPITKPCWEMTSTTLRPCIIDLCESDDDCPSGDRCKQTPSGKLCRRVKCGRGWRLNVEKRRCQDVNECAEGTHNCLENEICINTRGRFRCDVNYNYYQAPPPCSVPPPGTTTVNPCMVTKSTTTMRPRVVCPIGYSRGKRALCEVINPCEPNPCGKEEKCSAFNGTFTCSNAFDEGKCLNGFKQNGNFCEDINECAKDENICQHLGNHTECLNIPGGHKCYERKCEDGYEVNGDGKFMKCVATIRCSHILDPNCKPYAMSEIFLNAFSNETDEKVLFTFKNHSKIEVEIKNFIATPEEDKVEMAHMNDFGIIEHSLVALKPLYGPQQIQIDFLVSFYYNGQLYYKNIQRVWIYVSKFSANRYENFVKAEKE